VLDHHLHRVVLFDDVDDDDGLMTVDLKNLMKMMEMVYQCLMMGLIYNSIPDQSNL
jgi:hypothetical protein